MHTHMRVHTCTHTATHTHSCTHAHGAHMHTHRHRYTPVHTHTGTHTHPHTCTHTDVLLHAQHGGPGVLLKYGSAFYQRNGSPSCFILCEILPVLTNSISRCYYALVCLHTSAIPRTSPLPRPLLLEKALLYLI